MNKVNPIATLLSVKLMLDWLGESQMATRLEDAIATVIKEGNVRTYDMGGSSTTTQIAEEVSRKL
jgi:isocitrate/isopropylmalate dehydrogenase